MPGKVQILRTVTPDAAPTGLLEGELAVEMASTLPRLWVGVPASVDASGRRQLNAAAPPLFIGDTPPAAPVTGQLWWKSDLGKTFVWYTDANSSQWVEV